MATTIREAIQKLISVYHQLADEYNQKAGVTYYNVQDLKNRDHYRLVTRDLTKVLIDHPEVKDTRYDDLLARVISYRKDFAKATYGCSSEVNNWPQVIAYDEAQKPKKSENLLVWEAKGFSHRVNNGSRTAFSFDYWKSDQERKDHWLKGFDWADKLLALVDAPEVVAALVKNVWDKVKNHKKGVADVTTPKV